MLTVFKEIRGCNGWGKQRFHSKYSKEHQLKTAVFSTETIAPEDNSAEINN